MSERTGAAGPRSRYLPPVLGVPVPLASGVDRPFHEGLAAHRLRLQRCGGCGGWQWPAEVLCYRCRSFDLGWEDVPAEGSLFSWTRVWHPAREGLEAAVPYLAAVVEIPRAGGIRLVGNLLGDPARAPVIGEPLHGVFEDHPARPGGYALLHWQPGQD
jgi:uncharacterized OB-fold protein